MAQRAQIGDAFAALAAKYKISQPSESAFSSHFSIISWPIANALLPIDLVGSIGRLMTRAPVAALPGPGRAANFASLRAWASAAEGARLADWLRFEGPSERAFPLDAETAWVGIRIKGSAIERLRPLGSVCGYRIFEANLRDNDERAILAAAGMLSDNARSSIARHPADAIAAPQAIVRPGRPFLLFKSGPPLSAEAPRALTAGERVTAISGPAGHPGARCEVALPPENAPVDLSLFERDSAFEALIEQRLQIRVESPIALRDLGVSAELEIGGRLIVRSFARVGELPTTIDEGSPLLQALYSDSARNKLLEAGSGVLRFAIGRLVKTEVQLERPLASVDWSGDLPELIGAQLASELVSASTPWPHRFAPANAIALPERGATAYALRLADGRIADLISARQVYLRASSFLISPSSICFSSVPIRPLLAAISLLVMKHYQTAVLLFASLHSGRSSQSAGKPASARSLVGCVSRCCTRSCN